MRSFGMTTPLVADGVIGQNKEWHLRQFPRRGSAAHGVSVAGYTRRLATIACVLGLGLTLGSCGGFVADHLPRWAGGMPSDVPPRPGAPGYDEFIAHGQADQMPPKPAAASPTAANAGPNQKAAAGPAQPVFQQAPAAPTAAADDQPAEDSSVVKGGLY